ncbi:hypothetical protein [Gandjariella thermophila]|uniref:DUF5709 domain-containing protein n=1 Tax=Gandjariella thermophila TaxID=1931992 RepID=A0A4D4J5T2_9PSEU|nr:hypothetical protein [Gandjariella thermophila]GDY30098.1 hypothetical protein GTS_17310 [Gandjariella thermophila]
MAQRDEEHPDGREFSESERRDPAETLDALERRVLGAHPEDLHDVHDDAEHADAATHGQDLDPEDLAGVDGRATPQAEPPA